MDESDVLRRRLADLEARVAELTKSELRLASVLAIARIGSWELDLETMVADWSPETRLLLGVAPDAPSVPETVLGICAAPEDREIVRGALGAALSGSGRYDIVYRIRWRDGSLRVIHSRGDVLSGGGRARRIVGVVQDVTEQEQLRTQLLHAGKLEIVGRLAAGLAHDLNNMLTVIQGSCEFAAAAVGDHEVRQDLAIITDATERAATLTRDLLAFSRQQVLRPEPTDANQAIASLRKMLGQALGEDITLDLQVSRSIRPVFVDPQQLAQVLMNLAMNARDAMPHGGTLSIETAEAELPSELGPSGPPYVRIRVRDTGVGMDAATLGRIFEPFFTTKGTLGSGLGLSTAFGIVTQSGGQIRAQSIPGGGSTFEIYLPVSDRSPTRRHTAPRPGRAVGDGAVVLVVDDDPPVRHMAARILLRAGYRVIEAPDGESAQGLGAREPRIDLLVTDVMMPGMSGRQLADLLLAARPKLRILFISGYAGDPRIGTSGPRSGDPFLAKPFTPDQLVQSVAEVLSARVLRR